MLKLRTTKRAVTLTAAALALAGGTALASAGSAGAATHPGPAATHSDAQLKVLSKLAPGYCFTPINIGQPGNVYGWNGRYAGQVEQQYNTCDGTVWAHYAWDSGYAATYGGDTITLTVSSPEGDYSLPLQFSANQGHDQTVGGRNIHNVSPDDWRAGASWNNNGCVAWGTLHWYGGADWSGPKATCGSWIAPR